MQTQAGPYVAAADFDRLKQRLENTEKVLGDALNMAADLMRQVEAKQLSAADAEKVLRVTVELEM